METTTEAIISPEQFALQFAKDLLSCEPMQRQTFAKGWGSHLQAREEKIAQEAGLAARIQLLKGLDSALEDQGLDTARSVIKIALQHHVGMAG